MSYLDDYDYDSDDYDYDSDDYHHERDDDADRESVKKWSNAYAHLLDYSTSRTTNTTIKITPRKPIALLKESESKTDFRKISSSNLLSVPKTQEEQRTKKDPNTNRDPTKPKNCPTSRPTQKPTPKPSAKPTNYPTSRPNQKPTSKPSTKPTNNPTNRPTRKPTSSPPTKPTNYPTSRPTRRPTPKPSAKPTNYPTRPGNNRNRKLQRQNRLQKHEPHHQEPNHQYQLMDCYLR